MGKTFSDGKVILMVFVAVIVAVVLIQPIADRLFLSKNTFNQTNATATAPQINLTTALTGRSLVTGTTPIIRNTTNIELQNAGVIISDGLINGVQTVYITTNQSGFPNNVTSVNVSYEFVPDGYLNDSGSRSLAVVILIFAALAALVAVIVAVVGKDNLGRFFMGRGK